ncbi:ABC transporter ATP-binding protein [Lactobacillus delbrueckii subsp. bulgaricus]|uniref:hypothetical protein n=1 Tax=Lactobacillus delbrueckii TaxID=1584 RepID=UPI0021176851|nr:hypothetical protein [Lactobacillus delbrueckii]MCT3467036.1 ABC transporter ATP-binding protein [Lactobacillus delbrueckii subsp. bulgaricus]MCT3471934.1 ABC transporter ATP-binding protein [Lactobacillus delbrueckii subsp. bulgaricus]
MEIGSLLTFLTYATQILMSFMMLYMLFIVIPRASVSAKRINEVLDAENQLQDPVKSVSMPKGPAELEFDQVSFRYAGAEEVYRAQGRQLHPPAAGWLRDPVKRRRDKYFPGAKAALDDCPGLFS